MLKRIKNYLELLIEKHSLQDIEYIEKVKKEFDSKFIEIYNRQEEIQVKCNLISDSIDKSNIGLKQADEKWSKVILLENKLLGHDQEIMNKFNEFSKEFEKISQEIDKLKNFLLIN